MKILSVSSEHTESENEIAFNVDGTLTAEFMGLLHYGSLALRAWGDVLIIQKDEDSEPFGYDFVATLQGKLDAAQKTLDDAARKRHQTQLLMAQRLELPLV